MDALGNNVYLLFIFWVFLPAVACYWLALKKRRSTLLWLLLGMVFGILAVGYLWFLPGLKMKEFKVAHKDKFETKMNLYANLKEIEDLKSKNFEN
jgi:hypothetical protein